jgi:hypothetical protein
VEKRREKNNPSQQKMSWKKCDLIFLNAALQLRGLIAPWRAGIKVIPVICKKPSISVLKILKNFIAR